MNRFRKAGYIDCDGEFGSAPVAAKSIAERW